MTDAPGGHTPAKILVVDDEEQNRRLVASLLKASDYEIRYANDGVEAIQALNDFRPDLILLDVMMPRMNGFEAAREMKRNPDTRTIPIIMLTSLDDRASRLHALAAGAEEFLTKPVEQTELLVRVRNLLRIKAYSDMLTTHNRLLLERVRERTQQLRDSNREAIHIMTAVIERHDEGSGAHVRRISDYAAALARHIGLGQEYAETIFFASPMHDVGKIGVPDAILLKPGPLSAAEWEIMKSHAALGEVILARGQSPFLRMGAEIAGAHHENWDGTGYPRALKGDAIPLSARIMTICDKYDALRSRRPYKPPLAHARAMEIISHGDERSRPEHFDPTVLLAFLQLQEMFAEIFDTYTDSRAAPTPASAVRATGQSVSKALGDYQEDNARDDSPHGA